MIATCFVLTNIFAPYKKYGEWIKRLFAAQATIIE
jgi:hypothetical protein